MRRPSRKSLPIAVLAAVLCWTVTLLAAVVHQDTFTDTAGDNVRTQHTPEVGGGYTNQSGSSDSWVITDANRARMGTAMVDSHLCSNASPASNDYDVEAQWVAQGSFDPDSAYGLWGRASTADVTGYVVFYQNDATNKWVLLELVSGSASELDNDNTNIDTSSTLSVKLELRDATKKVYIDTGGGYSEIMSSATDNITQVGKGCLGGFANTADTNSTGIHFDNFTITDLSSAGGGNSGLLLLGVGR